MKKSIILLMCCLVLLGCGKTEAVDTDKATKVTQDSNEAIEYTYSDLQDLCEKFWDRWSSETENLSDIEWYGTSEDEEKSNEHYYEVSNKYAKKVFEDFEIPQGQKVIVSGYVSKVSSSDEDAFFVRKGCGRIFFWLKHNASDNEYDGILCQTDDESFLDLENNTPIKIEAVFMKEGDVAAQSDLFDCKLIEKGEPVDVETNAPYPTAAIVQ